MALTKEQKQKILKDLKEKIARQKSIVLVGFKGLEVTKMTELRKKMKEQDCEFKVAKKTLIQLALEKTSPEIGKKIKEFKKEIALGFGYEDEITPFKILGKFSKENKNLEILGGITHNQKPEFLEAEQAIILSELPTKEELLTRLLGSIQSPVLNFLNVLQGNIKGLINVLAKAKT